MQSTNWLGRIARQDNELARPVQVSMVLAMDQTRLGLADEAHATLEQGLQLAEAHMPKANAREFGTGWVEWVIAQVLIREAKESINVQGDGGGR